MANKTILVTDDSKVSRMMISSMIKEKKDDVEIVEAENGEQALELIENKEIDFFSLDLNMPGIDGLTLAEKLKVKFPKAKYVLLTANIQDFTEKRSSELGIHCVHKPITEQAIDSILEYFYG